MYAFMLLFFHGEERDQSMSFRVKVIKECILISGKSIDADQYIIPTILQPKSIVFNYLEVYQEILDCKDI